MKVDGRFAIGVAGVFYGGVTVDASLLSKGGLSILDISFFFLVISIIPLVPFVASGNILRKMLSASRFLGAYALVNTFILFSQFGSIALGLSPPIVALLLYTQPIWTVIFGRSLFNEKINTVRLAVIAIALIGVILVTNPFSIQPSFSNEPIAELLALLGGVFLSLWIILGKKGRLDNFKDPVELTFAVRSASCIPIAAISFLTLP
ncbi:MAG: EamA family transporter, partial [Nitrososphaerales archaeon]